MKCNIFHWLLVAYSVMKCLLDAEKQCKEQQKAFANCKSLYLSLAWKKYQKCSMSVCVGYRKMQRIVFYIQATNISYWVLQTFSAIFATCSSCKAFSTQNIFFYYFSVASWDCPVRRLSSGIPWCHWFY